MISNDQSCVSITSVLLVTALVLLAVHEDLHVVLLQGREVLSGLGELSLLHALAPIPSIEKTGLYRPYISKLVLAECAL